MISLRWRDLGSAKKSMVPAIAPNRPHEAPDCFSVSQRNAYNAAGPSTFYNRNRDLLVVEHFYALVAVSEECHDKG